MLWYLVLRLATILARRLPERWGTAIARWAGRMIYRISPMAEASRDNAWHVLGHDAYPAQVSQVACGAFEERVLNYYDMLRLSALPVNRISSRAHIEGLEQALHLIEQKRGAVVVSAHIGPVEFMMHAVASYGYPLIGITEHLKPELLHNFVIGLRAAHGLNLISTKASLVDIYRRIKRGEVLLSMVDRDSTNTGLIVDLFGEPAWIPDGYARLAVRANVPVVFGFCVRTENGAMGRIYPAIYPDRSLGKEEAIRDVIQRTMPYLEEAIRHNPAAWHLSTPIWRLAQERLKEGTPE